jgi:hypothetical protein
MSILERLKKNREKTQQMFKQSSEKREFENPFYYPKLTDQKNANVILRLLPSKNEDELPYVTVYNHFFKGDTGRWVITEVCATTNGQPCPVCEYNSKLWRTGDPALMQIAKNRKRRKKFVCNVYVVKDPESPEKEGKVFPFMFGPEVFGLIAEQIKPEFESDEPCFPFDLFEGSDFNFRVTFQKDKGMPTYKNSKFINKGTAFLDGDEQKIEEILQSMPELSKWTDPSRGKSYDRLMADCQEGYLNVIDIVAPAFDSGKSSAPKPIKSMPVKDTMKALESPDPMPTDADLPSGAVEKDEDEDEIAYLRRIAAN